ncbi:hypothetical protein EFV37_13195 [Mesorhizobium loti]|uniref:Uncharacterized protein n=1 Tax=Mesorhizobium jarvisii TaxID=1777867 RepID=A0A6M7TE53_9HYPH|nr:MULTISPECIES: hypothetical protein [Mesorhizobium]OBQ58038.1 hypothetical protein A9K72_27935 [Mesorhizobium loti]QKC63150.1 hypothetical protein EB229_13185 [Mesorhizobium jarvisii]QKD09061.1 hypothetical protein EFV37_13195 [Mesorhizobium loti]RJT30157.1 hypothetical protein D3242_25920 [Mesorhizobium jarvisii]
MRRRVNPPPIDPTTGRPAELLSILATLDLLAEAGDGSARQAANILRAQRGSSGRPAENDNLALTRIAELAAEGRGSHAVTIVAREIAQQTGGNPEAIARRLRRKNKRTK